MYDFVYINDKKTPDEELYKKAQKNIPAGTYAFEIDELSWCENGKYKVVFRLTSVVTGTTDWLVIYYTEEKDPRSPYQLFCKMVTDALQLEYLSPGALNGAVGKLDLVYLTFNDAVYPIISRIHAIQIDRDTYVHCVQTERDEETARYQEYMRICENVLAVAGNKSAKCWINQPANWEDDI